MIAYRRMTWGLSLLTVLTLSLSFSIIAVLLVRNQEEQLDESLLSIARTEAEEAPANHFTFSGSSAPASNDVGPLDNYGVLYDERHHVLSATRPFDRDAPAYTDVNEPLDQPFDFGWAGRRYRAVLVKIPEFPDRRLLLAVSREDLERDTQFVRKAMAVALLVSLVWLLGAIQWLVRRSVREHERVAEILHRVASGDVKARVPEEVSDQELRRVVVDIDEITQKLATLIEHQRRFIAHAAHELRSPLTALHGEIQQALRKERSAEDYRASLKFLLKASGRLTHLANELLALARAEHASDDAAVVSVPAVIAQVIETLQPIAREKSVSIEHADAEGVVQGNASDVERIVRNMLDNAIRHSPVGGTVRIEVEATDPVRIRVRDEGRGVAANEREAIFEPFYRSAKNRAQGEGTGLGLAIARELARKHGGELRVDDDPNCFVLSLPRAA